MSERPDTEAVYNLMIAFARPLTLITVEQVQAVVDELGFIDAAMPIVDPTRYRAILKTKPAHDRFAHAFLRFRRELEALKEGLEL